LELLKGSNVVELARSNGISQNQLFQWRDRFHEAGKSELQVKRCKDPTEKEIGRLERKIGQLTLQVEILQEVARLKKGAARLSGRFIALPWVTPKRLLQLPLACIVRPCTVRMKRDLSGSLCWTKGWHCRSEESLIKRKRLITGGLGRICGLRKVSWLTKRKFIGLLDLMVGSACCGTVPV
jgi:transposase-like protein